MEFREWMEKIWEYCQEHWIGLAAAGLVVLILLLSAWLVHLARRDQQEEVSLKEIQPESAPENQTEQEPEAEPDPENEPENESETEPEDEPKPDGEPEAADEPEETLCEAASAKDEAYELLDILKSINARISEERNVKDTESPAEAAEVCEKAEVPAEAAARGLVAQIIRGAEKAGETAGREVASINLEIEKARLIIRYTDENEKTARIPEVLLSEGETSDFEENRQLVKPEAERTPDACEPQSTPKKFGSYNMNRTRSGRVYTEEELREKIKE